jgi:hypothetical protein
MVSNLKELIDEPELAGIDDPEERFTTSSVNRLTRNLLFAVSW